LIKKRSQVITVYAVTLADYSYRVTTCLVNPEILGNLTAVREFTESQGMLEKSGKNLVRGKLFMLTSSVGLHQCLIDLGHLVLPS